MASLVAAPDKFRGTATAMQAASAIALAASDVGMGADQCPMSDGGEGFVDALGGDVRAAAVRGPLGERVTARWSLLVDGTAVVESAEACGRALLRHPSGDDPLLASTYGVGELVAAAVEASATRVVIGCGGTSSTDGGAGCIAALDDLGVRVAVPLVVACDVGVRFVDAAAMFGPQKGATEGQVVALRARLDSLTARYVERWGIDVCGLDGAGAGGGLAGGLAALGATLVQGARYVANRVSLQARIGAADLVVTGEGRVDRTTLAGKVVHAVLDADRSVPAVLVAGSIDSDVVASLQSRRDGRVVAIELGSSPNDPASTTERIRAVTAAALSGLV